MSREVAIGLASPDCGPHRGGVEQWTGCRVVQVPAKEFGTSGWPITYIRLSEYSRGLLCRRQDRRGSPNRAGLQGQRARASPDARRRASRRPCVHRTVPAPECSSPAGSSTNPCLFQGPGLWRPGSEWRSRLPAPHPGHLAGRTASTDGLAPLQALIDNELWTSLSVLRLFTVLGARRRAAPPRTRSPSPISKAGDDRGSASGSLGIAEVQKGFRRVKGYVHMPLLVAAIRPAATVAVQKKVT